MTSSCLACGGSLGDAMFSIPDLPLVDSFCKSADEARLVPRYSIDLCQCSCCDTIQVASPPDTSPIYKNYIYESGSSPDLLDHFTEYAQFVKNAVGGVGGHVLEIGANDGLLLNQLIEVGFRNLVAIDPSPQTSRIDLPGVRVINEFFSPQSVSRLEPQSFSVIIANNCFSHIPDLVAVLELCRGLLEDTGTLFVEVQSTLDLIENVVFDYIYHEHLFYHTAASFEKVAEKAGLELYGIEHVRTKGGSYRLLLGHPMQHARQSELVYWKYREGIAQVNNATTWRTLELYLRSVKAQIHQVLSEMPRPVIGYGASATSTVFLRYMNLESMVSSIVDDNPKRQYLFAPGSAIPTLPPDALERAGVCLILAWRHSALIGPALESRGLAYVIPLPALSVHGSESDVSAYVNF